MPESDSGGGSPPMLATARMQRSPGRLGHGSSGLPGGTRGRSRSRGGSATSSSGAPSDITSSFLQDEIFSIIDGNSHELHDLVEDKDIAARAVAFVVNSTRKGIVPLCSDVACLLRSKKVLEHRIAKLKGENEFLRSSRSASIRTSQSTSPPPSINSYSDRSLPEHGSHTHERPSRPCSRCSSHCSSLVSNSPKLDKVHPHHPRSPRLHRTSAFTPRNANQHMTVAMVHNQLNNVHPTAADLGDTALLRPKVHHHRKNSLPEMVSEPHGSVPKINPRVKNISKEIQCEMELETMSDQRLQDQLRETVKLNSGLAEELGAAKKEIQVLRDRLKELEMNQLARQYVDQFNQENGYKLENEVQKKRSPLSSKMSRGSRENPLLVPVVNSQPSSGGSSPCANSPVLLGRGRESSPIIMPGPMYGCKCKECEGENQDLVTSRVDASSPCLKLKNGITCNKDTWSHRLQVEVDDHVVVKGERTGKVRYIGHLDGPAKHSHRDTVFVGLELDAPVSNHDGSVDGKRYFSCPKNHGVFLPLQDILCIISKATHTERDSSYTSEDERPKLSRHPSDSSTTSSGSKRKISRGSSLTQKDRAKAASEKQLLPDLHNLQLLRKTSKRDDHVV